MAIDWRIVLGALCGGVAVTCWLEARHQIKQAQRRIGRVYQGTAVLTIVLAVSLFAKANLNPSARRLAPLRVPQKTAVSSTLPINTPLAPPSVFVMATPSSRQHIIPTPVAHSTTDAAYMQIPSLHISQPIIDLPLQNGRWDVSTLGEQIGKLASTGTHPGDKLAPVFAGHMTFPTSATLETGAFANLQYATYGTEIIYSANSEQFIYEVTEISRVAPTEVERLYVEDTNSILLVTCTDWDENGRFYTNRLLIRATHKSTINH